MDYSKNSPIRGVAPVFLIERPNASVEMITVFADTGIAYIDLGGKPNEFELQSYTFDSTGNTRSSRQGIFKSNSMTLESAAYFHFTPIRINNQQRYLLYSEPIFPWPSGGGMSWCIHEFDSALNYLRTYQIPFLGALDNSIVPFSNNRFVISGTKYVTQPVIGSSEENHSMMVDGNDFSIVSWFISKNKCLGPSGFISPSIYRLTDRENGVFKEHLINHLITGGGGSSSKYSVVKQLFKDVEQLPCRGAQRQIPQQPLLDVTNEFSLTWQSAGVLPIRNDYRINFKDTLFPYTAVNRLYDLVDVCDTTRGGLIVDKEITVNCKDSLDLPLDLVTSSYDVVEVNGVKTSIPAFLYTVRKPGLQVFKLYDTCALTQPLIDSIYVRFNSNLDFNLAEDSVKLCANQLHTMALPAFSGYSYQWVPSIYFDNPQASTQTVKASRLPLGLNLITVEAWLGTTCSRKDSLWVLTAQNPNLNISPDTLSLCPEQSATVSLLPQPNVNYSWEPSNLFSNPRANNQKFVANNLAEGRNLITVEAKNQSLCAAKVTLWIFKHPTPLASVLASNPDSVLWLEPSAGLQSFEWSVNGGNPAGPRNRDTLRVNWSSFFNGQEAEVRFVSQKGCLGEATYSRPQQDTSFLAFQFPNLVTINKDGKNDFFEILNQKSGDLVELSVYNRWGKEVYSNGRYSGGFPDEDLINGTYFCSIKISYIRNQTLRTAKYNGWIEVMN